MGRWLEPNETDDIWEQIANLWHDPLWFSQSTHYKRRGTCCTMKAEISWKATRTLVAVEPRRPPVTEVGTDTVGHDQRKHFHKSKHLFRSEFSWCDQTSIDLHLCRSAFRTILIYMFSVTDFDPKGSISEVRGLAGLYLDILGADRSPNAVRDHAGTTQVDFEVDRLHHLQILHQEIFDYHGKRNSYHKKRVSKKWKTVKFVCISLIDLITAIFRWP